MEGQEPPGPPPPPPPLPLPRIRIFFMGGAPNPLNILEQSFQEDKPRDTPVSQEFKESLDEEDDVQNIYTNAIFKG